MSSKFYLAEESTSWKQEVSDGTSWEQVAADGTRWEKEAADGSRWEQKEGADGTRWEKEVAGGSMWEQETFDGFFEQALALAVKLEEKRARTKRLKRESRRKEKSSRGSTMNCR